MLKTTIFQIYMPKKSAVLRGRRIRNLFVAGQTCYFIGWPNYLCLKHIDDVTDFYRDERRCSSVGGAPAGDQKGAGSMLESGISSLCTCRKTLNVNFPSGAIQSTNWLKTLQTAPKKGCPVLAGCLVHAKETRDDRDNRNTECSRSRVNSREHFNLVFSRNKSVPVIFYQT